MKMINKIFKKYIKEKEKKIKGSTDYVEKYNDLSLKFDDAEMTSKMLKKKEKKRMINMKKNTKIRRRIRRKCKIY